MNNKNSAENKMIEKKEGVFYYNLHDEKNQFEKVYMEVRAEEGRIYSDEELLRLPETEPTHKLADEWKIRKSSSARLINYLKKKKNPLTIMDFGCGNGWLSNSLAEIPMSEVYAVDINKSELIQGARVFKHSRNLKFIYANIFKDNFDSSSFDIITAASCVQYFPSLSGLVKRLLSLLKPRGELHIIDTPFYKLNEVEYARARTKSHYKQLGFPEMSSFYHHHTKAELDSFSFEFLYNPFYLKERINNRLYAKGHSPFPWIKIVRNN